MYVFIDRLKSVISNKSVKLIQINLITVFKDKTFNWYYYEFSEHIKWGYNINIFIDAWCNAFIKRFEFSHKKLIARLKVY